MPEFLLILVAVLLMLFTSGAAWSSDTKADKDFRVLVEKFNSGEEEIFKKNAFIFFKNYPDSTHIPEVRMMLAEIESDTELAVERFRSVVKFFPSYSRRDLALYRLCQILDLKSKWKELKEESSQGIKLFDRGKYGYEFRFMYISSLLMLEEYEQARTEAIAITEKTHDYHTLSRAIFILSEIDRRTTGNSRSYIYSLRELAAGFSDSELYPSTLYRLGLFYDERKDADRAFSAYTDLVKLFPESPESLMAAERIDKLKKLNPKKVEYIPDTEMVNRTDRLDLSPEYRVEDSGEEIYFSVSIGPFTRQGDADSVIRLLKNYPDRRRVKAQSGYFIYVGRFRDTDRAFQSRVRLAEEFGINGNIVRFSEQGNRSYIYGD